jgi:hypothetical protein
MAVHPCGAKDDCHECTATCAAADGIITPEPFAIPLGWLLIYAELLAYAEIPVPYDSPEFPHKPEFPR